MTGSTLVYPTCHCGQRDPLPVILEAGPVARPHRRGVGHAACTVVYAPDPATGRVEAIEAHGRVEAVLAEAHARWADALEQAA